MWSLLEHPRKKKYSGLNYSLNDPLKVCISYDLRKIYSVFTLMFVCMTLIYVLLQMACFLLKILLKCYSTQIRKLYLLSHWKRWTVWWAKHRFGIFGKIIPSGLSKTIQRICSLVFHILWELRVQILKNYEDKAKGPLLMFVSMSLICPILNGIFPSQSAPKVLLELNKDFYSLWNFTNCVKLGEN